MRLHGPCQMNLYCARIPQPWDGGSSGGPRLSTLSTDRARSSWRWGPILRGLTGEPIVRPPVGSCSRWMSIVAYIDWSTSSNRKTRLRMDTESTGWKIENLLPGRRDFQRLAVKYERYAESFLGMLQLASSLMLPGIY